MIWRRLAAPGRWSAFLCLQNKLRVSAVEALARVEQHRNWTPREKAACWLGLMRPGGKVRRVAGWHGIMTLASVDQLVQHANIFQSNAESYRRHAATQRRRKGKYRADGPSAGAD